MFMAKDGWDGPAACPIPGSPTAYGVDRRHCPGLAHGNGQERVLGMGRLVRLAALVVLCLVSSGCLSDDIGPLRRLPEATLYYPGAKVVYENAHGRNIGPDGQGPASYGHFLAVNATPDEVIAFYDRELKARGWTKSAKSLSIVDLSEGLWTKPGLYMSVDTQHPPDGDPAYVGYDLAVDATIYEDWPPSSSPS